METQVMQPKKRPGPRTKAAVETPWRDEPAAQGATPLRRKRVPKGPTNLDERWLTPLPIAPMSSLSSLDRARNLEPILSYARPRISVVVGPEELSQLRLPKLYKARGWASDDHAHFSSPMLDDIVIQGCLMQDIPWDACALLLPVTPIPAILFPFSEPLDADPVEDLDWNWVVRKYRSMRSAEMLCLETVPLYETLPSQTASETELLPPYGLMAMGLLLAQRLEQRIEGEIFPARNGGQRVYLSLEGETVQRVTRRNKKK